MSLGGEWCTREHFFEILPMKRANAEHIYFAIVEYCMKKKFSWEGIKMGFDGAATFSGDKTGVQRRLKEL